MFPSAPVVYFLDACRERLKTTPRQSWPDEVQRFASDFSQTFPLVEESQRELLDFYAPSEAMKLVLSKLASGKPFPAPKTLRFLTVQAQIRALSATAGWDDSCGRIYNCTFRSYQLLSIPSSAHYIMKG
jgi:hypothetical protein